MLSPFSWRNMEGEKTRLNFLQHKSIANWNSKRKVQLHQIFSCFPCENGREQQQAKFTNTPMCRSLGDVWHWVNHCIDIPTHKGPCSWTNHIQLATISNPCSSIMNPWKACIRPWCKQQFDKIKGIAHICSDAVLSCNSTLAKNQNDFFKICCLVNLMNTWEMKDINFSQITIQIMSALCQMLLSLSFLPLWWFLCPIHQFLCPIHWKLWFDCQP